MEGLEFSVEVVLRKKLGGRIEKGLVVCFEEGGGVLVGWCADDGVERWKEGREGLL